MQDLVVGQVMAPDVSRRGATRPVIDDGNCFVIGHSAVFSIPVRWLATLGSLTISDFVGAGNSVSRCNRERQGASRDREEIPDLSG